jgi:hypothetical protein
VFVQFAPGVASRQAAVSAAVMRVSSTLPAPPVLSKRSDRLPARTSREYVPRIRNSSVKEMSSPPL